MTKVLWGHINKIVCGLLHLPKALCNCCGWFGGRPKVIQGNGAPAVWAAVTGRDSSQAAQGCRIAEACTGKAGGACTREHPQNCGTLLHQPPSPSTPLHGKWQWQCGLCRACSVTEEGQGLFMLLAPAATCTMWPLSPCPAQGLYPCSCIRSQRAANCPYCLQ